MVKMLDCHSLKGNYISNKTQPKAVFILLKVLFYSLLQFIFVLVFDVEICILN